MDKQGGVSMTEPRIQELLNFGNENILLWDADGTIVDVNLATVDFFGVPTKEAFHKKNSELQPEYQPNGELSKTAMHKWVKLAFEKGEASFDWLYLKLSGRHVDCRIEMQVGDYRGKEVVCATVVDRFAVARERNENTEESSSWRVSDKMHIMLDAVPIGCWLYTMEGEAIDCNQYAVDMFEMGSKGEMNRSSVDACTPEFQRDGTPSLAYFRKAFMKAAQDGIFNGPITVKTTSGREIFCEVTFVRVEHNGNYAIMAALRESDNENFDLVRQIRSERAATQRMQAMLDSSPLLCLIMDKDANVLDVNQSTLTHSGLTSKKQYMEMFYEFAPPLQSDGTPSLEKVRQIVKQTMELGSLRCEWQHYHINGNLLPYELYMKKIRYDDKDAVIIHARDLTESHALKKLEDESQQYLQVMMDSSPLVCSLFCEDGVPFEVNQAAVTLFGLSDKSEYITKFSELLPKLQPDGIPTQAKYKLLVKTAFERGSANFEWLHQTLDGYPIPCDVHLKRVHLNGRDILIAYVWDLREQKRMLAKIEASFNQEQLATQAKARMEIAEESNAAKSRFLARMSHEIRTPITAVLGIAEIQLQSPELPKYLEEPFVKIHSSANLLLGIIKDILDLSKIEAGKMKAVQEEYETASMISDVTHLNLGYLGAKSVKFELEIDENIPSCLVGDVIRIEQIMNNLLSNAFKYTDSGVVRLSLHWDTTALLITITDTGYGMTKEQLHALTHNEYMRFHESENRFVGGTGLGMPIVYNLANIMKADVTIESEVGKGTKVSVRIPQEMHGTSILGMETVKSLQQLETSTQTAMKKFKFVPEPMPYGSVLVVDDVDANLYVAKGLLAFYDLRVETCESGCAAIEKIRAGNVYDLIFMDYMMPNMNGAEAMHAIRSLGYKNPIVVLTANALIGQSEQFIKQGFDGFVSKPIQTKHLNSVLLKFIRDKQPPEVIANASKKIAESKETPKESIENFQSSVSLQGKLRGNFAKSQKNTFLNISRAIELGDIPKARLLTHSLKGLAGLINEARLAKIAGEAEDLLAAGNTPPADLLENLKSELSAILNSINQPKPQNPSTTTEPAAPNKPENKVNPKELFDQLSPLLETRNSDAINLLEDLRQIPETAIIAAQIENFEFIVAKKSLDTLRRIMDL